MNRKQKRLALITEARTLAEKAQAENRDLTEDEQARALAIKSEVAELDRLIKADDEARAALKAITEAETEETDDETPTPGQKADRIEVRDRPKAPLSIGDAFVKGDAYKAFQKAHPSGLGAGSRAHLERTRVGDLNDALGRKALITTADAHIPNLRYPTLDLVDRPELTLLDVIGRGTMAGAFEYLQVTGVTRNAAIVPEATGAVDEETGEDLDPLKPISEFQTAIADAKPYTYADGYEVTTQMMSDAPALATFLNSEIPYSINTVIANKLLHGTGTNGEPRGIYNTTGVQQQAFVTDALTSIRKGISRIRRVGGQVTAVLVSPELDEALDLLKDTTGRYLGQGPWGTGPGTVWGRPRIVEEQLSGTNDTILGDFRTIALLDREGLSIEAFTQHKDYAQRNKVYVRAELRAGQVIWRPNRLAIVKISDGGGIQ